ncbi:MAG: hypothetical protein RLZZ227_2497 [Pseudomonadota bacterium]|jgi:Mg/Co/Ni transporter MgtE
MQEALNLALEFLEEHPDAAVRILEQHDAPQVAAFLETVPEAYSVRVLAQALPAFAAHLCQAFGNEMAARLMLQQDVGRMVAVLRHLQHMQIAAILNECPTSRRQSCALLLHYPVQCIGAWILPDTAVVAGDFTVGEALTFLKDANEEAVGPYVFVVNRDGVPEGRISYLALLKAHVDQRVQWIMEKPAEALSAQMPLAQAAKLTCWRDGDVMPVIGAQQQFIGVLRHADLRRGLQTQEHGRGAQKDATGDDPLSGLIEVYGKSMLALFDSVSNVVEGELRS